MQDAFDVLSMFGLYVPPGHFVHSILSPCPSFEKDPWLHLPFPDDELHPFKQYAPAGQYLQSLDEFEPSLMLYVPSGQSMHVDI